VITFHTPITFSTPHIYISTRPFLPSQSLLSRMFCREFSKAIKIRVGHLLSWPMPPLEWTGHAGGVLCVGYSPTGSRVVTGSEDKTIRIWDAESGAVVVGPLMGHNGWVESVAYSPDGWHITSGSHDHTIRIWDAETGAAVGNPLEGHTGSVYSVAYSPDGRHIISGSFDQTIRMWDANTGGSPLVMALSTLRCLFSRWAARHLRILGTIRIWDAETGDAVGNPLRCPLLSRWASHHLRILGPHHSNVGC
jgi:WD40 repeat protein